MEGSPVSDVEVADLSFAAQEVVIRELAFQICKNLIANAVGKCEFKTYRGGKEVRDAEYYMWNIEPNTNQNSTMFLHKLVGNLLTDNEALAISTHVKGQEQLVVADSFAVTEYAMKPNEYTNITVGNLPLRKTYKEQDVLHLMLNHSGIRTVLNSLCQSYHKLISAAVKRYGWESGRHWKVHVDQLAQNAPGWIDTFTKMTEKQIKPFLNAESAALPEFDGYTYEEIGGQNRGDTRDIRKLIDDIFDFTAKGFLIPPVLFGGEVAGTSDAMNRWLTVCIDPLCDQLQEEINRKRYGFEAWRSGSFLQIDTSTLIHFDMFASASNIEKLIGSGVFSVNDILTAAGLPRIDEPWADERFMTKNFSSVESLLQMMGGETT